MDHVKEGEAPGQSPDDRLEELLREKVLRIGVMALHGRGVDPVEFVEALARRVDGEGAAAGPCAADVLPDFGFIVVPERLVGQVQAAQDVGTARNGLAVERKQLIREYRQPRKRADGFALPGPVVTPSPK